MLSHKLLVIFLILTSHSAFGRVFNFQESGVSTYIRGSYGTINLQKYGFEPGFPTTTTFASGNILTNYSGEIGFAYQSGKTSFRLGVELLYPLASIGLLGKNAGGTTLATVDSLLASVIPKVALEFSYKSTPGFKGYFGIGGGYANTTIQNTVNLSGAGQAAYGLASSNYTEEASSKSFSGELFTGIEFAFFDNVGLSIDAGYRYLINNLFTATRDAQTAIQNLHIGDTVRTSAGTNRSLDLSGFYAGMAFRIYLR